VRKIIFVMAAVLVASIGMGRVESLIAHQEFAGPIASAQAWADSDSGDASSPDAMVPNVSGNYTGPVSDHRFGAGTITANITQMNSTLGGTWHTTINGGAGGTMNGSVKPNGKVHARLKITGQGGCGINIQGLFKNGNEIAGKYQVTGCGHADKGTFDMTD
jgi:hypothetical protein